MGQSLPNVLVVEDDAEIADLILHFLSSSRLGLNVNLAIDAVTALQSIREHRPCIVVIDESLPNISGLELIRKIHEVDGCESTKILFMTCRTEPEAWIQILETGAQDYIVKPFEPLALITKIQDLIKHVRLDEQSGQLSMGDLMINTRSSDVFYRGDRIVLTPHEFKLLNALMMHQGEVLTRDQLIEMVQGVGIAVIDRAIDTHVFSLRKKLGKAGDGIETVRGVGYRVRAMELM